ncbi:MAG: Crp/Fnr family transcriptional regulator [Candidatus Kryptoniota bacterium]
MVDINSILNNVPLFEKLNKNELKMVANISNMRRFRKGQIIFLEGETYGGLFILLKGTVKVYKLASDGSELTLHLLTPYRSFAEAPLFTGTKVYPACAQATEDSSLLYIPQRDFIAMMEKNPAVAVRISEGFAARLMELNQKLDTFGALSLTKLARYILNEITLNNTIKLPEPFFILRASKKDLASHIGIAGETLSRNLKILKEKKIIREKARTLFVTNLKLLSELAK